MSCNTVRILATRWLDVCGNQNMPAVIDSGSRHSKLTLDWSRTNGCLMTIVQQEKY
jgi:hypothetical protein